MTTLSNDEILKAIGQKTVLEIVELVKMFEDEFGVSAAAPVAVAAAASGDGAAAAEEQTEFNVIMSSFGDNKIGVIKVIRELTGLGLKEAKDMVEGVPSTIKEAIAKDEAETVKKKLVDACEQDVQQLEKGTQLINAHRWGTGQQTVLKEALGECCSAVKYIARY